MNFNHRIRTKVALISLIARWRIQRFFRASPRGRIFRKYAKLVSTWIGGTDFDCIDNSASDLKPHSMGFHSKRDETQATEFTLVASLELHPTTLRESQYLTNKTMVDFPQLAHYLGVRPLLVIATLFWIIAPRAHSETLTAYFCGSDSSAHAIVLQEQIDHWIVQNPDYDVDVMYHEWPTCGQRLTSLVERHTPPDIAYIGARELDRLVVFDHVNAMSVADTDRYYDFMTKYLTREDGTLNALPRALSSKALVYNRQLFRSAGLDPNNPPTTMDELLVAAKTINDETGKAGFCIVGSKSQETALRFLNIYYSFDPEFDLDEPDAEFDRANFLEALGFYSELRRYAQAALGTTEYRDCIDGFASGEYGMSIEGPWIIGIANDAKADFGVAPIPAAKGAIGRALLVFDTLVNLSEDQSEISNDLILYLGDETNQHEFESAAGLLPVRKTQDVAEGAVKIYVDALATGVREPTSVDSNRTLETLTSIVERYLRGGDNPGRLLERLNRSIRS